MVNIQWEVDDLLVRLREQGVDASVTYCLANGEIVSFEIKIIGFLA